MNEIIKFPEILPSVPAAIKAVEQLALEVRNAPTLESLLAITDAAAGYQRAFRRVKEVSDSAGGVQIDADVRLARELKKLPRAKGGAEKGVGRRGKQCGSNIEQHSAPSLAELGIKDRKKAARAYRIEELGDAKRDQYIAELKNDGKDVTPTAVLAKHRQAQKEKVKKKIMTAKFSASGPFGTVVIDPPWAMEKIDREVRPNQAEFDYPTMSNEEILALWERELASKIEPDCHLFMWTTQKFLPPALDLIKSMDFRYVLTMVWHKSGGFQPIGLPQYNCEFVVYARKGTSVFIDTKDFKVCNSWPRREHSRKPAEFYDLIRRVTGGSRIDVFSREEHEGFAQYGNEIEKFVGAA